MLRRLETWTPWRGLGDSHESSTSQRMGHLLVVAPTDQERWRAPQFDCGVSSTEYILVYTPNEPALQPRTSGFFSRASMHGLGSV